MTTLWSGRFDAAPDAAALEWGSSFSFDRRLFEDDVRGSAAWVRAIAKAGVLPGDDARALEAALADLLDRAAPGAGVCRRARTRTSTASSNGCWSSGWATPVVGCTRGDRATSRYRSTFGCICGGGSGCCSACVRQRSSRRSRTGQRIGRRRADAGVHAFPSGAAGPGRSFFPRACGGARARLRPARQPPATRPTPCRSGRARSPGRPTPIDVHALARDLGFSRDRREQHRCVVGSRLRGVVSVRLSR